MMLMMVFVWFKRELLIFRDGRISSRSTFLVLVWWLKSRIKKKKNSNNKYFISMDVGWKQAVRTIKHEERFIRKWTRICSNKSVKKRNSTLIENVDWSLSHGFVFLELTSFNSSYQFALFKNYFIFLLFWLSSSVFFSCCCANLYLQKKKTFNSRRLILIKSLLYNH